MIGLNRYAVGVTRLFVLGLRARQRRSDLMRIPS